MRIDFSTNAFSVRFPEEVIQQLIQKENYYPGYGLIYVDHPGRKSPSNELFCSLWFRTKLPIQYVGGKEDGIIIEKMTCRIFWRGLDMQLQSGFPRADQRDIIIKLRLEGLFALNPKSVHLEEALLNYNHRPSLLIGAPRDYIHVHLPYEKWIAQPDKYYADLFVVRIEEFFEFLLGGRFILR